MRHLLYLALIPILMLTACEKSGNSEPSAEELRVAASQTVFQINDEVRRIADECRGEGSVIVNPLKAMKCASVCSFDPKECRKIPKLEMTNFRKLACEKAAGQPGWVCDYEYTVSSDSDFLMKMFENTYGNQSRAKGRFIKSDMGDWILVDNGS